MSQPNFHITRKLGTNYYVIGFLRRNLSYCPTACRRNAYLSLVRSVIEYGAIVWDPYLQQDIDRLDRVQRKGVRFIKGDYKSRSPGCVTAMLASQNLSSLLLFFFSSLLFFVRTIVDWNHLADDVVNAPSADAFRNRLETVQSCS